MDINNIFKNYDKGGNNYNLKADSKNKWCGFNKNIIDQLIAKYKNNFNIVLWGTKSEQDFYCIPFSSIEHLFTHEHMTKGKLAEQGNERWTAVVNDHIFKMHANSMYSANIEIFYGKQDPVKIRNYEELDEVLGVDYTIEDAKASVNIRLKQSAFRKAVLNNFQSQCCISGINEQSMLVASHIVPWSSNKNYRSDPSNGLCLFVEFDAYFDKGYISIDEKLNIIVTKKVDQFSTELKNRLMQLEGKEIQRPTKHQIKNEYIVYHNQNIFDKFNELHCATYQSTQPTASLLSTLQPQSP